MLCTQCNYLTGMVPHQPQNPGQLNLWCYDCHNGTSRTMKQRARKAQREREREYRVRYGRPYGGATPIVEPTEVIAKGQGGTFDTIPGKHLETVEALIDNFDVTSVTKAECGRRADHVGKLPGETSDRPTCRIDRQGPSRKGTHAKFAVQIGSATYAGIEMPADLDFTLATVQKAFRDSIEYTTYALLSIQ